MILKSKYENKAAKLKAQYKIDLNEYQKTSNFKQFQKRLAEWKKDQRQQSNRRSIKESSDEDSDSSDDEESSSPSSVNHNSAFVSHMTREEAMRLSHFHHPVVGPKLNLVTSSRSNLVHPTC